MVDYSKVRPFGDRIIARTKPPAISNTLVVPDIWGGSLVEVIRSGNDNYHPGQELVINIDDAVVLVGGYDSGSVVVFREDAILAFPMGEYLLMAAGYIEVEPVHTHTELVVEGIQDMRTNVFERLFDGHRIIAKHDAGWVLTYKSKTYRIMSESDILAEEER